MDERERMDWSIIREPDDKMADVRVSLGTKKKLGSYIVFRGEPKEVIQLLEESLLEARRTLLKGEYKDHRGRPQG
jgi:hypothetical protein